MKAGQNNKYDITKTPGLLQVFPYILRREITKIWRNLHFYIFVTFSEYMNLLLISYAGYYMNFSQQWSVIVSRIEQQKQKLRNHQ